MNEAVLLDDRFPPDVTQCSQTEFARLLGVSKQRVGYLKKVGLPMENDVVLISEAVAWLKCRRVRSGLRGKGGAPSKRPAPDRLRKVRCKRPAPDRPRKVRCKRPAPDHSPSRGYINHRCYVGASPIQVSRMSRLIGEGATPEEARRLTDMEPPGYKKHRCYVGVSPARASRMSRLIRKGATPEQARRLTDGPGS